MITRARLVADRLGLSAQYFGRRGAHLFFRYEVVEHGLMRTRNPEPGTRNPEPGTRNPEPGTWNLEPGTWKVAQGCLSYTTVLVKGCPLEFLTVTTCVIVIPSAEMVMVLGLSDGLPST